MVRPTSVVLLVVLLGNHLACSQSDDGTSTTDDAADDDATELDGSSDAETDGDDIQDMAPPPLEGCFNPANWSCTANGGWCIADCGNQGMICDPNADHCSLNNGSDCPIDSPLEGCARCEAAVLSCPGEIH